MMLTPAPSAAAMMSRAISASPLTASWAVCSVRRYPLLRPKITRSSPDGEESGGTESGDGVEGVVFTVGLQLSDAGVSPLAGRRLLAEPR